MNNVVITRLAEGGERPHPHPVLEGGCWQVGSGELLTLFPESGFKEGKMRLIHWRSFLLLFLLIISYLFVN